MGQGKSKSQNTVETTTTSLVDVINQSMMSCTTPVSQSQVSNIVLGNGGVIDGLNINYNQAASVNFSCLQSTNTLNSLQTSMDTAVAQQAAAVNGSVLLPSGSASAKNLTSYVTSLGTAIKNAYVQDCSSLISQTQLSNVTLGDGSVIRGFDINFNQTADAVLNCVQNNTTVTQAETNLQTAIDQTAKSTVTGFPWMYVIIGAVVIFVIIALVIGAVIFFVVRSGSKVVESGIGEVSKYGQSVVGAYGGVAQNLTNVTGQVLTSEQFGKTVGVLGDTVGSLSNIIPAGAIGKVGGSLLGKGGAAAVTKAL